MALLSNIQKLKIRTVLIITLVWMIFLNLVFVYEFSSYKFRFPERFGQFNPLQEYAAIMVSGLLAGLIGGTFFVYNLKSSTVRRPFYSGVVLSTVYFLLIYIIVASTVSIMMLSLSRHAFPFNPDILRITFTENLFGPFQIRNMIVWSFMISITRFMLQVNNMFGPGNLWKIFSGEYYSPKEELRVFMFLDLKSSTTIAEKLGHTRYYYFLNDYYALISDPVINRYGEIYQYVGDEVVVSWTASHAIQDLNCLHCYFDIRDVIEKNKNGFLEKYNIVPEFKAGIHFGPVMAGEVGVIKRDIVFTGDVLNTASRIQVACNNYREDLLVSENTLALFDNLFPFEATFKDKIELRGKESRVGVYTLSMVDRGWRMEDGG